MLGKRKTFVLLFEVNSLAQLKKKKKYHRSKEQNDTQNPLPYWLSVGCTRVMLNNCGMETKYAFFKTLLQ